MHATPSHHRAHQRLALTTLGIYELLCMCVFVSVPVRMLQMLKMREKHTHTFTAFTQTLQWCQNWISLAGFPIGVFAF